MTDVHQCIEEKNEDGELKRNRISSGRISQILAELFRHLIETIEIAYVRAARGAKLERRRMRIPGRLKGENMIKMTGY